MPETVQNEFRGWAKVEVMGHQSHIGFVTTEVYGGAVLFRVDQPPVPESEETLTGDGWTDAGGPIPKGSIVKRGAIPGASVLIGAGSIYRIIPCDEQTAMISVRTNGRRPLMVVKLAAAAALESPADRRQTWPEDEDEEDEEEDELR